MSDHALLRPLRAGALFVLFNLLILASSSVFAMPAAATALNTVTVVF